MADSDRLPKEDPTVLTTEQLLRVVKSERDYTASQLATVDGEVRHARDIAAAEDRHIRELTSERFDSVWRQFTSSDTALKAAFEAQKEVAKVREEANKEAIQKSEASTNKVIEGVVSQVSDLKERVVGMQNMKAGGQDVIKGLYALAGLLFTMITIAVTVIIATR